MATAIRPLKLQLVSTKTQFTSYNKIRIKTGYRCPLGWMESAAIQTYKVELFNYGC